MTIKVLVFESDPAFAEELRIELDALGCTTTVVDDGNVGLQQIAAEKPDLVLLSIELPRMNGFSVCNKLKKDPATKDIPLIIMSSESSDETFDQHKKLRTRAEDYVHKPIAFADLLTHIRRLLPLNASSVSADQDSPILIEDEIEVGAADYLLEEEGSEDTSIFRPGPTGGSDPSERSHGGGARFSAGELGDPRTLQADFDAFADSAFDRLTGADHPVVPVEVEVRAPPNGARAADHTATIPPRSSFSSVPPRRSSSSPAGPMGDPAEHERLRAEMVVMRDRLESTQRDLGDARREADKLRLEAGDAARFAREADELRAKLAAAAKTGGLSSRDFLDLREALNRKDKELLSFREQLSRKDREIVEAQDRALALERARSDLEDRLLGLERQLAETREGQEALVAERDAARKIAEEMRARFEKGRTDVEARERQVSELRARNADERAANEVRLAAIRADLDQVLANERAEHARALDQAEQRRRADMEELRRERDGAVAEARAQAERDKREALSAQTAQLWQEHESKVAAIQRTQMQEIDRLRAEAAEGAQVAQEEQRVRHDEVVRALVEERDARIAALEARTAGEIAEARDAAVRAEAEATSVRQELQSVTDRRRADDAAMQGRIAELEQRLVELQGARDALDQGLAAARDRAAALQSELESLRRELADARDRATADAARAEQARVKWTADRQSLERAKDALAVALAQIEETDERGLS